MRNFDSQSAIASIELEQMIYDWARSIDEDYGITASGYFTPDLVYAAGRVAFNGRKAMDDFYTGRRADVKEASPDAGRTARHMVSNFRVIVNGADQATVTFLIINFSGFGAAPLFDAATPTVVSDVRCECRRSKGSPWQIAEFYGAPIFLGGDAFLTKSLVG